MTGSTVGVVRSGGMMRSSLAVALVLACAAPALATDDDLRSVAGMQHHNRVLIAFTPSLADPRLTAQRGVMAKLALEAATRDLLFVQVDPTKVIGSHDVGDKLRRQFKIPIDSYHILLIDKDGRVLREGAAPMDGALILQAIDQAPVRQAEVAHAAAGHPDTAAR